MHKEMGRTKQANNMNFQTAWEPSKWEHTLGLDCIGFELIRFCNNTFIPIKSTVKSKTSLQNAVISCHIVAAVI